jgi:uncharacterized membrane protein
MDHAIARPQAAIPAPVIRHVEAARPLAWLSRGWRDLRRTPLASLAHGAFVTLLGLGLLLTAGQAPYLVPAYLGGFLLVAPFAAIGLYALSRQIENGQAGDLRSAWQAWRPNAGSVAMFGFLLAVVLIFWERAAAVLFALLYTGHAVGAWALLTELATDPAHLPVATAFFLGGGLIAALVFTFGVVSVPMMLDRPVDVVTAMLTSLRCCLANPGAMLVWGLLIALLTALGLATGLLGLVVVFPLLGHASWHAWRDLVE